MKISRELLPGALLITLNRFADRRGSFVKTYSLNAFESLGVTFDLREEFYSISAKGVVRGMHFQLPPHAHEKIVYCPSGAILDVLVDLRKGTGFGRVASVVLQEDEPTILVIPKGVAHGFHSLRDGSLMVYKTSTEHAPSHDVGIYWDSLGFDWDVTAPIVSARDQAHPAFADFDSPF